VAGGAGRPFLSPRRDLPVGPHPRSLRPRRPSRPSGEPRRRASGRANPMPVVVGGQPVVVVAAPVVAVDAAVVAVVPAPVVVDGVVLLELHAAVPKLAARINADATRRIRMSFSNLGLGVGAAHRAPPVRRRATGRHRRPVYHQGPPRIPRAEDESRPHLVAVIGHIATGAPACVDAGGIRASPSRQPRNGLTGDRQEPSPEPPTVGRCPVWLPTQPSREGSGRGVALG
jgi:hypothetical protein